MRGGSKVQVHARLRWKPVASIAKRMINVAISRIRRKNAILSLATVICMMLPLVAPTTTCIRTITLIVYKEVRSVSEIPRTCQGFGTV